MFLRKFEEIQGLANGAPSLEAKLKALGVQSQEVFGCSEIAQGNDQAPAQLNVRFHAGDTELQNRPDATQHSTIDQRPAVRDQRQSPPQPASDLGVSWQMNQHQDPNLANLLPNHQQPTSHPALGLPQNIVGTMKQQNGLIVDPGRVCTSTANDMSMHPSQTSATRQAVPNWEFVAQNTFPAASTNVQGQQHELYDVDNLFDGLLRGNV
ncbi:hypothetical protein N7510_011572 [Penicillium lagena]|uniref:uncharacterized protein n=1 Tax=Penicillium lagena TaxID=94218 RepID=UPI0025406367|nr:uncharacterized protein N7510_011572 [Penicillium lagena]KAJ5602038.1 hypothetical protein N7510_011572 [Penicillium lagena]